MKILRSMKPVEADVYIKKLADETGISEGAIRFEYSGNNSQEKKLNSGGLTDRASDDKADGEGMPLIEMDLIKLMLIDAQYTQIPEDVAENAFSSGPGRMIYDSIKAADDGRRPLDTERLRDMLDEDAAECFREIEGKIIPSGREHDIFDECISRMRENYLKKQEEEIIIRLSMADEEENHDEIVRLTNKLIEIQKKIRT